MFSKSLRKQDADADRLLDETLELNARLIAEREKCTEDLERTIWNRRHDPDITRPSNERRYAHRR